MTNTIANQASRIIVNAIERTMVIRVLHVDDEPSILEISKQILMDMDSNFEIDHAYCVDEAFKKLAARDYDAIISDYEMPLKNGLQFLKELREQKNEIPFILFTGKGREEVAVTALNTGADGYYSKLGSPETIYGELIHGIRQSVNRKKSELALACSEAKFKVYVENSPVAVFVANAEGKYEYVNEAASKLLGYSREELLEMCIPQIIFKQEKFEDLKKFARVKEAGQSLSETSLKTKGGLPVYVILNSVKLPDGKLMAICENITERKKDEKAVRMSEARYRHLADSLPEIVFETDTNGKIIYVNESAFEITGYTKADIAKGVFAFDFFEQKDKQRAKENFSKTWTNNSLCDNEYTFIRKDGSTIPVIISSKPIIVDNKTVGLRGIVIDITQRKNAERGLMESEAKFRNLAEESPNMIFINYKGRVVYANKKCEDYMGYTKAEFYSPNFNFLSLCLPEYVDVLKSSFARHIKGENVSPYEYVLVTRNGKKLDAIITSKLIEYEGEKAILGIVTDITERKKAEEAMNHAMDELVLVNEKLNVVGSLTRHDVRNKLCTVTGNAYLIKKKYADQPGILDGLDKIAQAVKDSMKIFDFAKMYEQLGIEELKYVDVEDTIKEAGALFSGLNLKIINECHGLSLFADSFLRQLFYNFIDNTRKYGEKSSTIRVYFEKTDSGELRLIYEDDGVGISAENKLKLFTEGFSTGGSTGFGLFLSRKMMDVYGWAIQELGEPEKGAKFVITIPAINPNKHENYRIVA